jgi:hypothetical protein
MRLHHPSGGERLLELEQQVGPDQQVLRFRNTLPVDGVTFSLCFLRIVGSASS